MKEEKFFRAVFEEEGIGCWEVDAARDEFGMSETMQNWFGLKAGSIRLDEFKQMIPEPYRDRLLMMDELDSGRFPGDRVYPIRTPKGELWISFKPIDMRKNADGTAVLTGYAKRIDPEEKAAPRSVEIEKIDDLLYRLNSISHTLLSLQHADGTETVVSRILREILSMFHGDRAYIIEFDWERRMHVCRFEETASGVSAERENINRLMMDDLSWLTEAISSGEPIVISKLDELPPQAHREREVFEAQDIKSLIIMPLTSQDKVWGYAGIDVVDGSRNWSIVDRLWFSALINIIGLCLELQRSRQKAQEERDYLESLYCSMPVGFIRVEVLFDPEGEACDFRLLDANGAADKILGNRHEHYIGRKASELDSGMSAYLPAMVGALRTGRYMEHDVYAETHGNYRLLCSIPTGGNEVICLFSDVNEVHKVHDALLRNEKQLRNIFDNIQVGVELYDKEGKLVDVNNKDLDIFGIARREDVLGINFYDNPNVPEEVRENVRAGRDQAFRSNYHFDCLKGYYRTEKTGFLEIFSTVSMLYNMHGELDNFMLINIDNTEINRAHSRIAEFESSFSLVSRFGKVGYCRFDLLTRDGYGVPQWFHNLGEKEDTPLSEVIGVYSHVDPKDRAAVMDCIRRVKAGEIDSFGLDLRVNPGPDEKWTRINVMRNPMNNDPAKIEMVCVNYDITELKIAERNLIEAKNRAEVSDRLKSAFLANMSHEIRTPLNAIVGFSNLLAETDDPAERREFMHVVEENNELLLKLISDILDLSKIEAGTFEFESGPVDVDRMCEETVLALGLKVRNRPVELIFNPPQEKCRIIADKNRLVQVITNFINNALKFTEKGRITLKYALLGDYIRFEVADTGTGIAPEQQAAVFERFVKFNNFAQGTGLGLSICKSIVEQMGGQIGVESEVGKGSRFWFTVPAVVSDLPPTDDMPEQAAAESAPDPGARRPRLLVAEDTDSNYLLVLLTLRKEFDVIRACDGAEAVRMCLELHPDAVLMDIKMPEMDGLEATRRIRRSDPTVPIIALTAYAYDQDRQHALEAGCNDYLAKPLTGEKLRQTLRTLLAERRG